MNEMNRRGFIGSFVGGLVGGGVLGLVKPAPAPAAPCPTTLIDMSDLQAYLACVQQLTNVRAVVTQYGVPVSEDRPLCRLLQKPNMYFDLGDLVKRWCVNLDLHGVTFAWVAQSSFTIPTELYHLEPRYLVPHPDNHYLYKFDGKEIRIESDAILKFQYPNPLVNGVPISMIGLGKVYSSHIIQDVFKMMRCIRHLFLAPRWKFIAMELTKHLAPRFGEGFKISLIPCLESPTDNVPERS